MIEVLPSQHHRRGHTYWLPPYFASWRGGSLALVDSGLTALHAQLAGAFTPAERASLLGREQVFAPVADAAVQLRYGRRYDFRVRLADLTHGGPDWQVADAALPGTSILSIDFMRRHKPGPLNRLVDVPEAEPTTIVLEKPRLGYPEALFAGASMADIKADFDAIRRASASTPMATGSPASARSRRLRSGRHQSAHRRRGEVVERRLATHGLLYETERDMPDARLVVPLMFEQHSTLDSFSAAQPLNGPLVLPTAREVRLTFTRSDSTPRLLRHRRCASARPSRLSSGAVGQ